MNIRKKIIFCLVHAQNIPRINFCICFMIQYINNQMRISIDYLEFKENKTIDIFKMKIIRNN